MVVSGSNACYFAGYSSRLARRRWGAMALALVNLALFVQGLYLGVLPSFVGDWLLAGPRLRFAVGWLPLLAAVVIALFILRRARRR